MGSRSGRKLSTGYHLLLLANGDIVGRARALAGSLALGIDGLGLELCHLLGRDVGNHLVDLGTRDLQVVAGRDRRGSRNPRGQGRGRSQAGREPHGGGRLGAVSSDKNLIFFSFSFVPSGQDTEGEVSARAG